MLTCTSYTLAASRFAARGLIKLIDNRVEYIIRQPIVLTIVKRIFVCFTVHNCVLFRTYSGHSFRLIQDNPSEIVTVGIWPVKAHLRH